MKNKTNPLIADSSATKLQRVFEALAVFKKAITHNSTQEDIDNLQMVQEALAQAVEDYAVFEPQESTLMCELTADTLECVLHVISALHLTFETFNESTLFSPPMRSAFAGFAFILTGVKEALEFEIARNSGAIEVESEDDE